MVWCVALSLCSCVAFLVGCVCTLQFGFFDVEFGAGDDIYPKPSTHNPKPYIPGSPALRHFARRVRTCIDPVDRQCCLEVHG